VESATLCGGGTFGLASGHGWVLVVAMKPLSGVRVLQLLGGLGALTGAVVLWSSSDSHTALTGLLFGFGLILLAWMQFGEEFRKK
jgi:hypothetical protein